MFKIQCYPYKLNYGPFIGIREGLIISLQCETHIGYCDISPWPSLGDPSLHFFKKEINKISKKVHDLKQYKETIKQYKNTILGNSLENALIFCKNQKHIQSWFKVQSQWPQKNFLIFNLEQWVYVLSKKNYRSSYFFDQSPNLKSVSHIKIKTHFYHNLIKDLSYVFKKLPHIRLRLDFNLKWTFNQFNQFIIRLPDFILERIEYIEDPFPFNLKQWVQLNAQVPLAIDFAVNWKASLFRKALDHSAFSYGIFKPSRQSLQEVRSLKVPLTITSHLGHFVDNLWSWWIMDQLKKNQFSIHPVSGIVFYDF